MTDQPPLDKTIYMPPGDAIAAWAERAGYRFSPHWTDTWQEEHAAAFTVAKIAKLDLLVSIRSSLDKVIAEGGTFEQWKASILPELQKAGWWGFVQNEALTGTSEPIIVNDRRLKTIYRTNVRMSIAAGRWRKFQREKDLFPYLEYVSDHYRKHPRLDHQSWHGLILPIDDPAWQWMFPPNGWGCNCRVLQVSQSEVDRKRLTIGPAPNPPRRDFVTAAGEVIAVPAGIAPGFGYNPGTAHLRVLADRMTQALAGALAAGMDDAAATILRQQADDAAFLTLALAPDVAMPVAIADAASATSWGLSSRILILADDAIPASADPALRAALRSLPDLVDRAVLAARTEEGLLVWWEIGGNAALRARLITVEGKPAQIVEIVPTTLDDAAAETAGLDLILDRAP